MLAGSRNLALSDTVARISAFGDSFYLLPGQSNRKGMGDFSGQFINPTLPIADAEDPAQSYETAYSPVQIAWHIDDGSVHTQAFTDLQPYAAANNRNMGAELSLGRFLATYSPTPVKLAKYSADGTSLRLDWLAGANHAAASIAFFQAQQAALGGMRVGGVFLDQCEGDGNDSTSANAWAANCATYMAMLRAIFGPVPLVFKRQASWNTQTFTSTLRAQAATYAASDSNSVMLDTDDLTPQGDLLHYTTRSYQLFGDREGNAMLQKKGVISGSQPSVAAPFFVGADAQRIRGTTVDLHWMGGTIAGDVGILPVIGTKGGTANPPLALVTAAGFVPIGTAPLGTSGADHIWVTFYAARADATAIAANNGHMPTVTIPNANTNNWGKIYVFRGVPTTGAIYDIVASIAATAYSTACTIPGGVTTRTNQTAAMFSFGTVATAGSNKLGTFTPGSGLTNFAVQNVADEDTGTTSTAQGWVVASLATANIASAGAFGATTAVYPITTLQVNVTLTLIGQNSSAAPSLATVTQDATKGWYYPASPTEVATLFSAAGISSSGGFFAGYGMQEASGNLTDFSGNAFTLTAANAPSYQNADSGFTRKSVGMADGSSSNFNNVAAGLADPATTSYLMILMASALSAPAAVRSLGRIGGTNTLEPRVNATPVTSLLSQATSTNGLANPTTQGFQPWVVQHNATASIQQMMTAQEMIISSAFHALSTKTIQVGKTSTVSAAMHANGALFCSGVNSEITPSQIRKLMMLIMNGTEPLWI